MSVSRVYARALFEFGSQDSNSFKQTQSQMKQLVELIESHPILKRALYSPATANTEKSAIVEDLATRTGSTELLKRFLVLLAKKGRLSLLGRIQEDLNAVRLESEGGLLGLVVSADEMSDGDLASLAKDFSGKLNRPVEFKLEVDSRLIAGLKVTVNGVTYDGSLQAQIGRLREDFIHGTGNGLSH